MNIRPIDATSLYPHFIIFLNLMLKCEYDIEYSTRPLLSVYLNAIGRPLSIMSVMKYLPPFVNIIQEKEHIPSTGAVNIPEVAL